MTEVRELSDVLNILYGGYKGRAYGVEPDTKEMAFVQGQISGIGKALDALSIAEGMPVKHAEELTEADIERLQLELTALRIIEEGN